MVKEIHKRAYTEQLQYSGAFTNYMYLVITILDILKYYYETFSISKPQANN